MLKGINVITRRLATGERRRYFYHRRTGTRLPDDPTSPDFVARLRELESVTPTPAGIVPGTLHALIVSYKSSAEFRELSDKTKNDYTRYLDTLRVMWGQFRVVDFKRRHVRKLREKFGDRPRTANYFVQVFRLLMSFAIDEGLRESNPATNPRMLKTGPGHKPWPDVAVEKFKADAPKEMVTALMLGLYTGQRERDCLSMTWGALKNGGIEVTQSKTGEPLWVPLHRELRAYLDTQKQVSPIIVVDKKGRPFKVDHFRHCFHEAVVTCGLDGLTFHGLRKKATEMLAEAGCSDREIMAITGHKTHAMVGRYLDRAKQRERAISAIRKLEDKRGN